jgi:hypothetical protein
LALTGQLPGSLSIRTLPFVSVGNVAARSSMNLPSLEMVYRLRIVDAKTCVFLKALE